MQHQRQPQLVLRVVGGGWGVPSFSPVATALITYARLSGNGDRLKVVVNQHPVHLAATSHIVKLDRPVLEVPSNDGSSKPKKIHGFMNIVEELRANSMNLEDGLSDALQADILAFIALITDHLAPIFQHTLFLSDTTVNITRSAVLQSVSLPTSLIAFRAFRAEARSIASDADDVEQEASAHALKGLRALALKLGDKPFLFGRRPTLADCLLYGYMGVLSAAPLGTSLIGGLINTDVPALAAWADGIQRLHFNKERIEYRALLKREADQERKVTKETLTLVGSVAVAAALLGVYSVVVQRLPSNFLVVVS